MGKGVIKSIILDFGGVILNIDYGATVRAFESIGLKDFDSFYSQAAQSDLFDRLEVGAIEPLDFVNELRPYLPANTSDKKLTDAWNALLLDYDAKRFNYLAALKEEYSLYLLSNTNAIHAATFQATLARDFPGVSLTDYFHRVYYSHEIGMRKPHPETFQWVLNDAGIAATETLFVDDSIQHVQGAQQAGLHAYHLRPGEEIYEVLPRILAEFNQ